jgi:hypothetical protein
MIPSLLAVASLALIPPDAVEVGAFARPGPEAAALRTLAGISPTWDSPGLDAAGSMPIGNGTLGANVWVEANGDLVLLVGHTDAFSECERLLKLGRVRISCDPPIDVTRGFSQRLDLERGTITVEADGATLETLVDLGSPAMLVRFASASPRTVSARLENWRDAERRLERGELNSSWLMRDAPEPVAVVESADVVVPDSPAVTWYHRNERSYVPFTLGHQGLESIAGQVRDPLLHRTFGGRIEGDGLARIDAHSMRSVKPVTEATVRIVTRCAQDPDVATFLAGLDRASAAIGSFADAARRTADGWRGRWTSSWVFLDSPARAESLANPHPFRVGFDSDERNLFRGTLREVQFIPRPLPAAEIPEPVGDGMIFGREVGDSMDADAAPPVAGGFTIRAIVNPEVAGLTARIVDKVTAGRGDGFLLDLQGGKLRAVVGDSLVQTGAAPPAGVETPVALTVDTAAGECRIWMAGKEVGRGRLDRRATTVSEAYALQRFAAAAAAGGEFPVKFNGSIFTVAPRFVNGQPWNDDYRQWGGCYWWQNTRLPYHGMLARGDGDLTSPLFDFYARVAPASSARAAAYWACEGVVFPETMNTFGVCGNGDYGWKREGLAANDVDCPWWKHEWTQGPELVALMLDRWEWLGERDRLESQAIPMAREVVKYFLSRFPVGTDGRLSISPAQALETYWHGVRNDLPTLAGLHEIARRLQALPSDAGTPDDRELWKRLAAVLPPIPMTEPADGATRRFLPAAEFDPRRSNCENPELYAIWPFNHSGVGRGLLAEGRASYEGRIERMTHGWTQDGMQAARLGLADEAATNLLAKIRNTNPNFRFPTFWGPNFDWVPDQCHGGNLLTVTQEMLLQAANGKIIVCPALPTDWSGSFRLHAPGRTVVTATVGGGEIRSLDVQPPERRKDVVAGWGWTVVEQE